MREHDEKPFAKRFLHNVNEYREQRLSRSFDTHHCLAGPVELAVVDEATSLVQIVEELSQVLVVRRLEEVQPAYVA